jgi:tRNA (adenine22-N1)-methyltransferase
MLSKRLSKALSYIDKTKYFYDLCCDHGMLGMAVLENDLAEHVIFNDQVPHIIDNLKTSLSSYITKSIAFETKPCQKIKFKPNSTICILGVGCNTIHKLLEAIDNEQTLIISTHTRPLLLRQKLQSLGLNLIKEDLICENGKYYEILKLTTYGDHSVPLIGNFKKSEGYRKYLNDLAQYYKLKVTHENNSISKEILKIIKSKQKEFQ